MRLLLIDTCGSVGTAALATEQGVVASEEMAGRSASERLVAVVREMLAGAKWRLRELTAIVVVTGPGSFTGVRVGLSAAKGLSEAAGIPVVGVSRLAVLAAKVGEAGDEVCSVLDAGRGEFYTGVYARQTRVREALVSGEELRVLAKGMAAVVVCEAQVAEALSDLRPDLVREPGAQDALPLAVQRVEAGEFDDVAALDANYLRRTDLEIFAKVKGAAG